MYRDSKIKQTVKKAIIVCPNCGSQNTIKVRRTLIEKVICTFTFNRVAYAKYYCKLCDQYIVKSRSQTIRDEQYLENDNTFFEENED